MSKIISVSLITFILFLSFGFFLSYNSYAFKSEKAQGLHQKTTGDFIGLAGSTTIEMTISAHDTNPAKGNVYYSNSTGKYFEGFVTGYNQVDNKSVFVGEITNSNYSSVEKYFKVWTLDNGEGENSLADKFRVVLYTTQQTYNDVSTGYGASVVEGNIQVH